MAPKSGGNFGSTANSNHSMKSNVTIKIPEPCSQSWEEMTPEAGGRHCISCAKTVVDFTRMTDAQILEMLHKSAGGCGRFRTDQVNRELIALPAEKRGIFTPFYKLAASLLFVFSAGKATAQAPKAEPEIYVQTPIPQKAKVDKSSISGFVKDEFGEPLTGAIIRVDSNSSIKLFAGIDGEFELDLSNAAFQDDTLILRVNYIGYEEKNITFDRNSNPKFLEIIMLRDSANKENQMIGDVSIIIKHYRKVRHAKPNTTRLEDGSYLIEDKKKWWQFWKRQ